MIFEKLAALLSEQFGVDVDSITMDTSFEDLGADSLDIVEMTMAVEEEFGLEDMDEEDLSGISTVADLVRYLKSKLEDGRNQRDRSPASRRGSGFEREDRPWRHWKKSWVTGLPTGPFWKTPSPTAPTPTRTRPRDCRAMSGWNFWGTLCLVWSWPTTCSAPTPTCRKGI